VLSVLKGSKKHCLGYVWDVLGGDGWLVDPATKFVEKKQIEELFKLELVEEVGMVMMGVNVVALFAQQNLPHIIKTITPKPAK
jgi:translation initiation factor 6 (eIF-6)